MHSSSIRTTRFSGHLYRGSVQEGVCPGECLLRGESLPGSGVCPTGGFCPGVYIHGSVPGGCLSNECTPTGPRDKHLPCEQNDNRCKNITFSQRYLRVVTTMYQRDQIILINQEVRSFTEVSRFSLCELRFNPLEVRLNRS